MSGTSYIGIAHFVENHKDEKKNKWWITSYGILAVFTYIRILRPVGRHWSWKFLGDETIE
jgi:hypothetical protein